MKEKTRTIGGKEIGRVTRVSLALLFTFFVCFALNAAAQDLNSLSRAIQTGTSEQKRDALFQIRNLRSEASSRIALPALKDGDPIVRATAAASVAFLPKDEAVTMLAPLLSDKVPFVRKEAAYALESVESAAAAPALIDRLRRENDLEVRSAIVIALGGSGTTAALEPLVSILRSSPSEESEFLRRSAARSIGRIAQIAKSANAYVVTPENFLPEKYKTVNAGDIASGPPLFGSAESVLEAVLQNRKEADDTRRETAFALGAIGDKRAISVLESHLNSPDNYLAEICKEAILKIQK